MTIGEIKDKGLLLFECISGSRAYGLDTPKSDTDLKGVFYLPKDQFYGLNYIPQVSNETNDEVYYELGRFVKLLSKNNPNILEILATPDDCILYRHPVMDQLHIGMFLSKLCKDTFAGYAITQIRKARGLKKKIVNPVDKERKSILDFCYVVKGYSSVPVREWLSAKRLRQEQCGLAAVPHVKGLYALFYDHADMFAYKGIISGDTANDVSVSSIPKGEKELINLYFNNDGYSAYCREYREYWEWVDKRNEDRYRSTMQHGKDYDAKNMMHTIRLLQVAEEILTTGQLRVKRPNREELLSIKSGKAGYDDLLQQANGLIERIEAAYVSSPLPDVPDENLIGQVLVQMRTELYG
ncbi:MAG: nucleotidyltransferase domain-containing protein [Bacteroidales bacterium]|jgi:predicted nucleotidyltransferase|nr:nucleotidyltransferase domain-containing protein [Bacteroidales bacterium]